MTLKSENLNAMDFFRFDLRVGTVRSVESVPKSKKLLQLEVDFGPSSGCRTILAGLAPRLESVDSAGPGTYVVEGQKVVAIINLESRVMMGRKSHGMLLAAADATGKVYLVNPGDAPEGSEIG